MIGRIAALWIVGLALSVCVISCCTDEFTITGAHNLVAFEVLPDSSIGAPLDTISGPFELIAEAQVEILITQAPTLISTSLATTCNYDYSNEIAYAMLTSNRSFTYQGATIYPGTDFAYLASESDILHDQWTASARGRFDEQFIQNAEFEAEWHLLEVTITTNDGQTFISSDSLYFNL